MSCHYPSCMMGGGSCPYESNCEAVDDERAEAPHLTSEIKKLRDALRELIDVKIIKDVQGKTPEYFERRGKAWNAAYAFFPEYTQRKKEIPAGASVCAHGYPTDRRCAFCTFK